MNLERGIDKVSILGVAFVIGWIACLSSNHVKDLWSQHGQLVVEQTKVIPKLKAEARCEHHRADKTAVVATKAIAGANSDTAPIPSVADIPAACPHPK